MSHPAYGGGRSIPTTKFVDKYAVPKKVDI